MNLNLHQRRNSMTPPPSRSRMVLGACLVAVLLATSSVAAGPAWAASGGLPGTGDIRFNPGGDAEGNHCVTPEGVDVNELLGISEFLMAPWNPCFAVPAGEFWVPFFASAWNMNSSWEVVPADYTPSAPTPLEDFLSKVRSVTFTVDPGSALERSYRYAASDVLDVRSVHDFFPSLPDVPTALFLAKLPPLPVGDHRIEVAVELSTRHCNGFGADFEGNSVPGVNCLNSGSGLVGRCPFIVVPRLPAATEP